MLRLAFDFIITWRETRTRPNAYNEANILIISEKTDAKWILIFRQKNKRTKKESQNKFSCHKLRTNSIVL